jgi:ABC-2 type transport system permease protein
MYSIYMLTLRQSSGRFRLMIMSVLAVMPVLMALVAVRSMRAPSVEEFEIIVLSTMLAGSIMPLVVLTIASVAFANEVEDRTLANLTLAPIPRWQIVVPKLLAGVCVSAPFIVISAFVTSYIAFAGDVPATVAVTGAAFIGVLLYSSAFVWLGLVTTRAIGFGLLYIVLWEGFFSGFVSGDPRPGHFGIYTVDASAGEPATLITGEEEFWEHFEEPAPSPDGRTLAFLSAGTAFVHIILHDLRTGTHSAILTDPPLNAWPFVNLEYSPDGTRLLFVSGHDIYVLDVSKM